MHHLFAVHTVKNFYAVIKGIASKGAALLHIRMYGIL
jgi:hypothetical protein